MALGTVAMSGAAKANDEEGFSYYGSLNGGFVSVDDGVNTTTGFGDNSNAPSRIGFWYNTRLNSGMLKFNFETALGFGGVGGFDQSTQSGSFDWDKTNLRKVEVIYETDTYGTFYVGQGSMASDGIAGGTDMSGTDLVSTVSMDDTFGGFSFLTSAGVNSGISIGDAISDFDGGRKGRIRYDSPTFGDGFVVSVAAGQEVLKDNNNDRFYDVALRYGRDFGDTTFKGTLAYAVNDLSTGETRSVLGSVGALHNPSGVSGTLTVGDNDKSGNYVYGKVGYQQDWFSIGRTYLSADVYSSNDMVSSGDDALAWGLGVVQKINSANMEVFASYHSHAYNDTSITNYNDVNGYMIGARWLF